MLGARFGRQPFGAADLVVRNGLRLREIGASRAEFIPLPLAAALPGSDQIQAFRGLRKIRSAHGYKMPPEAGSVVANASFAVSEPMRLVQTRVALSKARPCGENEVILTRPLHHPAGRIPALPVRD